MKRIRRAGLIVVGLILLTVLIPINTALMDDPDINLNLTTPEASYWAGETVTVYCNVDMSSATTTYPNPTLTITFPSEHITSVSSSDMATQTSKTVVNDGTNWVVTYTFTQLAGGTSMSIPLVIANQNYYTPDGYPLPVNAVLADSGGSQLRTADQLDVIFNTKDIQVVKQIYVAENANHWRPEDGQIVYGGLADSSDPDLLSSDLNDLVNVMFWYQPSYITDDGSSANVGWRRFDQKIWTDTLPAGAYFDPAVNPGWTDNGDGTVTYTDDVDAYFYNYNNVPALKLKMPAANINNTYTNAISLTAIPVDKPDYEDIRTANDDIDFQLKNGTPGGGQFAKGNSRTYFDHMSSKVLTGTWNVQIYNVIGGLEMENIVIEDYDLDSRLQYVSIQNTMTTDQYVGSYTIEATSDGTNWATIVADADVSDTTVYDLPADTVKVRMSSTTGSYLKEFGYFRFTLTTEMKDPENTHTDVLVNMRNYASYSANYVGLSAEISGTNSGNSPFRPYQPVISFGKCIDGNMWKKSQTCLVNDEVNFTLRIVESSAFTPDYIDAQRIVDFLPIGLEYVPGSTTVWYSNSASADAILTLEPIVVENALDTGKTALIWQFDNPIYFSGNNSSTCYTLNYTTVATRDMEEGLSTNGAYLMWDNNGYSEDPSAITLVPYGTQPNDTLDLDLDGNTEEPTAYSKCDITFVPPLEVVAKKSVQGMFDSAFVNTGARTEIGEWAKYQLDATNHSLVPYNHLTVIDVLPYVGDTAICKDESGEYQPRESEFPVLLTGPATAPAGFTIYYTTDYPVDTEDKAYDYATDANWVTTPADYGEVIGVKFVMDEGESFDVEETCSFELPLTMSDADITLRNEQKSVNTFALSTNGTDYLEALNTTLRVVSYEIEGTAFEDTDEDGIMDTGEAPIEGVRVWLTDGEGNAVSDVAGNLYVTTTDENGYYHFDIQRNGDYIVSFEEPINYASTPVTVDPADTTGSHVIQGEVNTDTFHLGVIADYAQYAAVRNAGYLRDAGSLQISKELLDVNGSEIAEKRTFDFEVSVDGVLYNGPVYINGTEVTITNGALSIENGDDVWIHEILLDDTYTVTELGAENYAVLPVSKSISGTMDLDGELAEFENTEMPGTIGSTVWVDTNGNGVMGNDEYGIEGVIVNLLDDSGTVIGTTITDANGHYIFENVPAGTYNIVITMPDNYYQTYELDGELNGDTRVSVSSGEEKLDINFGFQNKDVFNPKEHIAIPQTGDFEIPLWVWLSLAGLLLGAIAAGVVLLRKYMARSIIV